MTDLLTLAPNLRVLIIGGAGFVGSHLAQRCLSAGARVSVYDNFSVGQRGNLPDAAALQIFEADLLDDSALCAAVGAVQPQVVYHLAAIHHIPTCEREPERALRVNVEGTQTLLSCCARHHIPRVIFASTGAVYAVSDHALDEAAPLQPRDIYGISKIAGEQLVAHYVRKTGSAAIIARLFNVVGAHETNPHLIPDMLAQLASGARVLRLGNLTPRRDYIHVRDIADALLTLSTLALTAAPDIYNIGSGKEHSVLQVIELMSQVLGEPLSVTTQPARQRQADRPSQLADIRKLQAASQWTPRHTLREALAEAWQERCAQNHATSPAN